MQNVPNVVSIVTEKKTVVSHGLIGQFMEQCTITQLWSGTKKEVITECTSLCPVTVGEKKAAPRSPVARQNYKTGRVRLRRGITVDSGAAANVMPKRMVRNKMRIRTSPGSRAGVHYIAANNGRIPNEGEVDFAFSTEEGHTEMLTMQIAEVNKALGSVSYLVDKGYRVTFDKCLRTGNDLSMMLNKKTNVTTRFRREKNVWVLDAYLPDGEHDAKSSGFTRQGAP